MLRFWESRFPQIRPVKRAGGRRYYRPSDVELLSGIKRLLHDDGLTIRGVQKILREQGVRFVSGINDPVADEAAMMMDAPPAPPARTSVVPFSRPTPPASDAPDLFSGIWNETSPEASAEVSADGGPGPEAADDNILADNTGSAARTAATPPTSPGTVGPEGTGGETGGSGNPPEPEDAEAETEAPPTGQPPTAKPLADPGVPTKTPAPDKIVVGARADGPATTPGDMTAVAPDQRPDAAVPASQPPEPVVPPTGRAAATAQASGESPTDDTRDVTGVVAGNVTGGSAPPVQPALEGPEAISGHWLAADLRALKPADLASRSQALLPLAARLKELRDRVADLGRVPRR